MFRLFSLKPFVLFLSVVSLFAFAPKAHATCMVQCSGVLTFDDCSTPQNPNIWPSSVLPTFQVECKTCCSPPGGPLQCSDSSFNATDFLLRDAQGQPLSGTFSLLTKSCNSKTLIQYSQTLSPAKGYDLLSRVPGGGNLILIQFDVVASSQESHAEHHHEVIPDPEKHSEVIPDPEQHSEHSEGGNPEEPVQDNPPTDDTTHDHPPIDNPPVDTPPTDRKTDDGGPDDATPDACGTTNPDASSADEVPRDGCGPTPTPDNAPSDNAPSDNAATDGAVKDSIGWGCEATSPAPTGLFFLLLGALFFKRRRTRWNA